VVQCHGCFDIVHPGHIRHLQHAARQGDLLLVTITADACVNKGDGRPLFNEELRAENLAALDCVDLVFVNPDPTAEKLLDEVRPDIFIKGREYESNKDPRFAAEREAVERHGGRVVDEENGQPAETRFRLLARDADGTALVEARPITGRTNQIRLHLWHAGHPIVGDAAYLLDRRLGHNASQSTAESPLCLHAWRLSFPQPFPLAHAEDALCQWEAGWPIWASASTVPSGSADAATNRASGLPTLTPSSRSCGAMGDPVAAPCSSTTIRSNDWSQALAAPSPVAAGQAISDHSSSPTRQ
jgi:rfaE bifunctional protein nucleotidyltransferase chain/domain